MNRFAGFPYTDATIREIAGLQMVVARHVHPGSMIEPIEMLTLGMDGSVKQAVGIGIARWRTDGGIFELLDHRDSVVYRFDGSEVFKSGQYGIGECLREGSLSGHVRAVAYLFKSMSEQKRVKVAISTHPDYLDVTLKPLCRSLTRHGFEPSDIMCVAPVLKGKSNNHDMPDGVELHLSQYDKIGFTALLYLAEPLNAQLHEDVDYWMLLNDTTELTSEFSMDKIDVGLNYDIIRFTKNCRLDMGFYSSNFIQSLGDISNVRADHLDSLISSKAQRECCVAGAANKGTGVLVSKDVYGTGNKREVTLFRDLGIKKYSGAVMNGGKP